MSGESSLFHRHDLLVLVGGAVLVAIGALAQGSGGGSNAFAKLERDGLAVQYPRNPKWFPPGGDGYPAVITSAQCSTDPKVTCADLPTGQITVRVYDDSLGLGEVQSGKDHDAEYGDRAKRNISLDAPREIGGKTWKCMRFAYVPVGARSESVAVECSVVNNKKLYVVTLSGPEAYVAALEPDVINQLVVR